MKSLLVAALLVLSVSFVSAQNCATCEFLVTSIESWVENNQTEAQIIANLEQLCSLVPAFQSVCDQYVTQAVPQIISYIESNYTPEQVCAAIGLCAMPPKNGFKPLLKVKPGANKPLLKVKPGANKPLLKVKPNSPKVKDGPFCPYCQSAVGIVEQWVANNATIAEIEANLEQFCSLIPDYTALCNALIVSEIPQIIAWLEANETPYSVCQQLGLC